MTRIFLPILSLFMSLAAAAQVSSSCVPTALLTSYYYNDAKDMALARMYAIQSPDTSLIEIPAIHSDSAMAGLAAIYNTNGALESDSVFNNYCVHTLPYGFTRKTISVSVDTSYAWAKEWAMLHSVTGNTALDNFMSLHGFTVTHFYTYSWGNNVILTTTHTLNWRAFADSLALFGGVYTTSEDHLAGTGDYIHYQKDTVQTYTFFAGWGDCPAGCTSGKTWTYKVDNACNVSLISTARMGWEPDYYMPNCRLFPIKVQQVPNDVTIRIYPVPANDLLHVSLMGIRGECRYTLTDIYGETIQQGAISSGEMTTNISSLAGGVYLLSVNDGEGRVYVEKVVKR